MCIFRFRRLDLNFQRTWAAEVFLSAPRSARCGTMRRKTGISSVNTSLLNKWTIFAGRNHVGCRVGGSTAFAKRLELSWAKRTWVMLHHRQSGEKMLFGVICSAGLELSCPALMVDKYPHTALEPHQGVLESNLINLGLVCVSRGATQSFLVNRCCPITRSTKNDIFQPKYEYEREI